MQCHGLRQTCPLDEMYPDRATGSPGDAAGRDGTVTTLFRPWALLTKMRISCKSSLARQATALNSLAFCWAGVPFGFGLTRSTAASAANSLPSGPGTTTPWLGSDSQEGSRSPKSMTKKEDDEKKKHLAERDCKGDGKVGDNLSQYSTNRGQATSIRHGQHRDFDSRLQPQRNQPIMTTNLTIFQRL